MNKTVLSIFLILSALLASCNPDNINSKTEIRMQIEWAENSGRGELIRCILNDFQKENPDIAVELIGGTQNSQKTVMTILSGKAPEVMQVAYRNLRELAAQDAFEEVGKYFDQDKIFFNANLWNLAVVEGKLYGIPWLGHSMQLIYNRDMFEKAGIKEPPKTWQELYADAFKLTGNGKYGIGLPGQQSNDLSWSLDMFIYAGGAKLVKKEPDGSYSVALNTTEGRNAVQFYLKLMKECAPPDSAEKTGKEIMDDFRNQKVAMEFQGPWGVTDIWKSGNPFRVGVAPIPAGPGGSFAEIGPYMLAIPAGVSGEKFNAAVKLISFMISRKGQEMILTGEKGSDGKSYPFRIPVRNDLQDSEFFKAHHEFLLFVTGLNNPSIATPIEAWNKVDVEVFRMNINKCITGQMSVDKALDIIEKQGNKLLQSDKR